MNVYLSSVTVKSPCGSKWKRDFEELPCLLAFSLKCIVISCCKVFYGFEN